ncbi:hypothetical protein H5410_057371 [Solanum commersonii]|uniref:Uncharacterized protein n=1 Tax=Solanum commersonii TaxID=4109 RepID=A0A9J5WPH6_SOLCO|nr:hypothetical protein H5410_057371 [Solanum commersonii]
MKRIFLEYDMHSELMERTTSSATIEEHHEVRKKFLADCDQLTAEVNLNFTTYEFMKCSSKLIINFIQPFSFAVSKVVKLNQNFEDNDSLKVVLAIKISMDIAYYKIIDLKAGKAVDFKRKRIFLEYDMQSELMERTTSSATIEECHELHKKFLANCDQLTAELKSSLGNENSMEIAYYKIIDLVAKLGETS